MNEYLSLSQLRQLTQERMQVKLYKNDEYKKIIIM